MDSVWRAGNSHGYRNAWCNLKIENIVHAKIQAKAENVSSDGVDTQSCGERENADCVVIFQGRIEMKWQDRWHYT